MLQRYLTNGWPEGFLITIIVLLSAIGGLILLLACIHFMHLRTSRRVIGFQFLSEALLLIFCVLLLGLLLVQLALPGCMKLPGKSFTPAWWNWLVWVLLLGMGFVTGMVGGSYPARGRGDL
jgi:hypothetical protein